MSRPGLHQAGPARDIEYARRFDEAHRQRDPLQKKRIGRSFLKSARNPDGIDIENVIEVCTQVVCNRAH